MQLDTNILNVDLFENIIIDIERELKTHLLGEIIA
jgi:hypothetical protein